MELGRELKSTKDNLYEVLRSLRLNNGFYKASHSKEYNYSWLRDNFYCALPELKSNPKLYMQTYHAWLDYYANIEKQYGKFTHIINKGRVDYDWEFPHVRVNLDLTEIHNQSWNHAQLDTLGYFLLGVALGQNNGIPIIRNENDKKTIDLVIKFLESINYCSFPEAGAWEEDHNVRSSSIGAVTSGLQAIKYIGFNVPQYLIENGYKTLNGLLYNETKTRKYDLAQLFLIYPFNIVSTEQAKIIVKNIEDNLLRERGVIRYQGDKYYSKDNKEAEWLFGSAYLSVIHSRFGNVDKARYYLNKILFNCTNGNIPELFYGGTSTPNPNNPLGWSNAMTILAIEELK